MTQINLDEKIEEYKTLLRKPFWELREAVFILNGETDFMMEYKLDPTISKALGLESFGLLPENDFECHKVKHKKPYGFNFYMVLVKKIENDEIFAYALKLFGIKYSLQPNRHTYLIYPHEVIAVAVTEGFILPKELQIATNLYQIDQYSKSFSEPIKKQIRRQAITQAFWHKYPQETISGICRRINRLKEYKREEKSFEFLNDSKNRNRKIVKDLKPPSTGITLCIPGSIKRQDNYTAFDFQRVKIIIETIAKLLFLANKNLTDQELRNHPLITCYVLEAGYQAERIINFSLSNTLEAIHWSNFDPSI